MKSTVILIYVLFSLASYSQQIVEETYGLPSYDFICFKNDTVIYSLSLRGGISLSVIGMGTYKKRRRVIKINHLDILEHTSSVYIEKRKDKCIGLYLLDNDSNEVSFATITIKDDRGQTVQDIMDKKGQHLICFGQSELKSSKKMTIRMETISFETQKTMSLEIGKNYYFKSNIRWDRPLTVYPAGEVLKIKYKDLDESRMELQYLKNKIELTKRSNSNCGLHYILANQ